MSEIWLYGEVGESMWGDGITAKSFIDELNVAEDDTVTVRINSMGGDVFEAQAMYSALIRSPKTITTTIDGAALSAASVVAMGGDRIVMAANAQIMIHDPWAFVIGNAKDLRDLAEILDKSKETIAYTYARRKGVDYESIWDAMTAETWYTAQEALDAGLVDEVTEGAAVAALVDPRRYRHVPEGLAKRPSATRPPEQARHRLAHAERLLKLVRIGVDGHP